MDAFSIFSALSSTITIADFIKRFINSLGCIESSPEIEDKVNKAIENFKNAQEDNNDLLIRLLKEIPQLSGMKEEYLQTQFENTLKDSPHSNIAQLNHSNGNQITQTTHHHYAPPAPEKPSQINGDKLKRQEIENLFESVKELIIEFLQLAVQYSDNAESKKQFYIAAEIIDSDGASYTDIDHKETALLLMCMHYLKDTYNLTKDQCQMIFTTISGMTPKVIGKTYIDFNSKHDIVFIIKDLNHSEKINRDNFTLCNIESIPKLLQKIQNGIMDNYIKTSIKELG